MPQSPPRFSPPLRRRGFTLVEILVVIGIIAVLAGILIPVIGHVRIAGYETNTKAQISTIAGAIEQYQTTFSSGYPGPIANADLIGGSSGKNLCTGTENLTLALLGGWTTTSGYVYTDVGQGPMSLNPAKVQRYPAFIDAKTGNLQKPNAAGKWVAKGQELLSPLGNTSHLFNDKDIPEFLDRFPDPLPILYVRANPSAARVTDKATTPNTPNTFQYNTRELVAYNFPEPNTARVTAEKKRFPTDPYLNGSKGENEYFFNPTSATSITTTGAAPFQKDAFILISAGRDRIFMSADDMTNFGSPK